MTMKIKIMRTRPLQTATSLSSVSVNSSGIKYTYT